MKGILADINVLRHVEYLVELMQSDPWPEFWLALHLVLHRFEDVGLTATATDLEIWKRCQTEELLLLTNNRNDEGPDSLEASIRDHNTPNALPVFTIANLDRLRKSRSYADRVVEVFYEYLLRIDDMRGSGRILLP